MFWYNLKKNGIGNPRTRHAACPVLVGTKWGECLVISKIDIEIKLY